MITEQQPALVNGRHYPLWQQFVDKKAQWIGGTLEDFGDSMDRRMGSEKQTGIITDICLRPNGDDSAYFEVSTGDSGCGFDVEYGGVGAGEPGWITFHGYGGHMWRIKGNGK